DGTANVGVQRKDSSVFPKSKRFLTFALGAWLTLSGNPERLAAEPGTNASIVSSNSLEQHVAELKRSVPPGFTLVLQPPFVVIGDEASEIVKSRAIRTVKWSVDELKQEY